MAMTVQDIQDVADRVDEARAEERERCAKIADKYAERTNADIAHAIANEIRKAN